METSRSLTLETLNGNTAKAQEIKESVDYQLDFLIGHFQAPSFLETYKSPGVLGDQYKIRFTSVEKRSEGRQKLHYRFEGKTVFHTKVFSKGNLSAVPLRLPLDPYSLYALGVVRGKNRCTDEHYDSEGDFFYFWDPDKEGCPLRGNSEDVLRIEGKLKQLPNTLSTYPEYDRLYLADELNISVFLGYIDDDPKISRNKDHGHRTFRELKKKLISQGYLVVEEKNFKTINYLVRLEKDLRNQLGVKQTVKVSLLLSDSSVGITDQTFVRSFSEALMNSQIVAYDGHSGLGGNLDFGRFGINQLPSFYQIYFFNGCSSYPYFNSIFFDQKPAGKKNLEIITAGLPTLTSTSTSNMLSFLAPFIGGKIYSYQTILRSLERSNNEEGTYLMGVNGDEDNLFKPKEGRQPLLRKNF